MRLLRFAVVQLLLLYLYLPAFAVNPNEKLANPVLEQRARDISAGLRCLVCQNESIDDSDADLAKDLRVLVRQQLTQGKTDDQIVQYLRDRYGNFITLKPPLQANTLFLWFAPLAALLLAGTTYVIFLKRRGDGQSIDTELSDEELSQLKDLERD